MNLDRLVARLAEEISGARAKRIAEEISRFHRIQGSPGYSEAIDHVRAALAAVGIESKVHEYPADGRSKTYEWTAPPAWSVRSGSLRQTEPKERALASFEEIPQSVVVHSPGGAVEGELVHVGSGTADADYEGTDVRAKLVLACGRASEVEKKAGPRGAVGIVIYPDSERASADHDLVQYEGIFPRADAIEALVPAFSISHREADRLMKALDRGPVRLYGEIDAEFIDGRLRVLEALVRGKDAGAGEVVFVAHICHPRQSANDNASGSALLVEIARAMKTLREEIGLRHTVRFVWVPEFYGTLPWAVAHTEELKRAHFVLNLDMVGQSPDVIGEPLHLSRVPNAIPSYLNACIEPIATLVGALGAVAPGGTRRAFHWSFDVPCGGSDHLVFGASPHRLPAVMLHHDDPFWHTSHDTVDKVDSSRLKQVGILSVTLAMLPSVREKDPCLLQEWLLSFGVAAMTEASALARQLDPKSGRKLLEIALRIEEERVDDLVRSLSDGVDSSRLDSHKVALRAAFDHVVSLLGEPGVAGEATRSDRKPKRIVDGPLVYIVTERFDDDEKVFFKEKLSSEHRAIAESLLGLCDGIRTVEEIALQLSLDFDRIIGFADVERGVDLLVKVGYLVG